MSGEGVSCSEKGVVVEAFEVEFKQVDGWPDEFFYKFVESGGGDILAEVVPVRLRGGVECGV